MKTIINSKKEIIKHKKVERQTHNKNNLIFEKRTPKEHKKDQHKRNIKRYHITGLLKETARNHTPTPGLTHQRGRPEHAL